MISFVVFTRMCSTARGYRIWLINPYSSGQEDMGSHVVLFFVKWYTITSEACGQPEEVQYTRAKPTQIMVV